MRTAEQIREYHRLYRRAWRKKNPEREKAYRCERNRTQYKREWRKKNPDRVKVARQRHNKKHRHKILAWKKAYGRDHRAQINQRRREVYAVNPFTALAYNHNRRARMKKAGAIRADVIQRVYEDNVKKYGTLTCYICGNPIGFKQGSLDHITPLFRGGSNLYENLAVAHKKCNSSKCARTWAEYLMDKSGVFDD